MGGNALSYQTRRLEKQEYDQIVSELVTIFATFSGIEILHVPAYRSKETFGDADFVIDASVPCDIVEWVIREKLRGTEIVVNGQVWSFDYKKFQVDFVFSNEVDWLVQWMSFNDLSNLAGRLGHMLGTKFGQKGLTLPIRHRDQVVDEIILTTNYAEALRFVGLDPKHHADGFDSLEDIFQYVASSPFFNPDVYLLHNRNAQSRIRDKKRPTYMAFLKWCEEHASSLGQYQRHVDKSMYHQMIFDAFTGTKEKFDRVMEKVSLNDLLRSKFNGTMVREISGLEGKELGALVQHLRKFIVDDFVQHAPEDVILAAVRRGCELYKEGI